MGCSLHGTDEDGGLSERRETALKLPLCIVAVPVTL